jgi:hypothetical protein
MKNRILLSAMLFTAVCSSVKAQSDSTAADSVKRADKKYISGFGVSAEFGVLSNSSFTEMRRQLKLLGTEPFGSLMSSIVLTRRMESSRWVSEHRIVLMNSTKENDEINVKRASLWGVGLGLNAGPKLVNTTRWNVFVPIGFDAMFYKMGIKSNHSASLNQVINNTGNFQAVKLYTASLNVNAGVGVDYKTNFMKKHNDQFYISGRVSYHLPVVSRGQWRGENVQVNDLEKFKPNQLYVSLGIVIIPKLSGHKWGGMH